MERDPSHWQSFDPRDASLPPGLDGGDGGRVVAVVASEEVDPEWSADAAVGLARAWAREHDRVLLADLQLARPRLHTRLGVENGEGVSDMLLWGASVGRVARPVDGILFAGAGTAVADTGAVLRSARWARITDGFREAGAGLFLFVGNGDPGLPELLERVGEVVLLTARDDAAPRVGGRDVSVVLGPEGARDGSDAEGEEEKEEPAAGPAAGEEPEGAPGERPAGEAWEDELTQSVAALEGEGSRTGLWIGLAVLVLLLLLLAAAFGLISLPLVPAFLAGRTDRRLPVPGGAAPVGTGPAAPAPEG